MISFNKFKSCTKNYINNEKFSKGHALLADQNSKVLISAPHGVSQTRLGLPKVAEIGSARLAVTLSQLCKTNLIIKTKNMFDDANFDEKSLYKKDIKALIKKQNIRYVLDFHGLAAKRECDINLGINFGDNIKNNIQLFEKLASSLKKTGFKVNIDNPFCGKYSTISSFCAKSCNVWSIQIEVNCKITNDSKNIEKLNKLIECLHSFIEKIDK